MNREKFEVWKADKERECELEAAPPARDMPMYQVVIKKYEAEIEVARLEMEAEEKQKRVWFPNGNWRPPLFSAIVSAVFAIIVGVAVYCLTNVPPKID